MSENAPEIVAMHYQDFGRHRAAEKLRELACWYREFAERAGSTTIWEARLHMAEDLETEAARLASLQQHSYAE